MNTTPFLLIPRSVLMKSHMGGHLYNLGMSSIWPSEFIDTDKFDELNMEVDLCLNWEEDLFGDGIVIQYSEDDKRFF